LCWNGQEVPQQALPPWQQVPPQVSVVQDGWQLPAEQPWPSGQALLHDPQ
jgi:hypothetical protein